MATIMIVDDYPVMQRILSYQLNRTGHQIVTANNGREAIDSLDAVGVDLMIVDLAMPEMDGISMMRHLRADHRYDGVPVIMLTASGKEHDRVLAISAGVDAFLTKPTSTWELTGIVNSLLAERHAVTM